MKLSPPPNVSGIFTVISPPFMFSFTEILIRPESHIRCVVSPCLFYNLCFVLRDLDEAALVDEDENLRIVNDVADVDVEESVCELLPRPMSKLESDKNCTFLVCSEPCKSKMREMMVT